MELAAGAEAGVHQAQIRQLRQGGFVEGGALALIVRLVGAAPAGARVPVQAQPAEVGLQLLGVAAGAAGNVQVFDAEDDLSALLAGAEPGDETAEQVSQMDAPAGRGRKTAGGHGRASFP